MKRIVICADGTWNVRDALNKETGKRRPTNVTKVARATISSIAGVSQVVFYHDGIGTGGGMDRFTGGAFGDGIENNVRDLYRSIAYNYADGDEAFFVRVQPRRVHRTHAGRVHESCRPPAKGR